MKGWTAADAYGMTDTGSNGCDPESISLSTQTLKISKGNNDDVTVTVLGKDNCPSEGVTVEATISEKDSKRIEISSDSEETDENGEAVFAITSKKKGNAKVTFEANGLKTKLKVKVK